MIETVGYAGNGRKARQGRGDAGRGGRHVFEAGVRRWRCWCDVREV